MRNGYLFLLFSIVFATAAFAGSVTDNLTLSATVAETCSIVSVTPINFGNITHDANYLANGDITVNCQTGTTYHIALDAGQHLDGVRSLASGDNLIGYRLFQDPSGTSEWGDNDFANTYPLGSSLADTANGTDQSHTVYGATFSYADPFAAGNYSDTVVVTVIF